MLIVHFFHAYNACQIYSNTSKQKQKKKGKMPLCFSWIYQTFSFFSLNVQSFFSSHGFKMEIDTLAILSPLFSLQGTGGVSSSTSPCLQSLVGRCFLSSPLSGKGTSKAPAVLGMHGPESGPFSSSSYVNRTGLMLISSHLLWWQVEITPPKHVKSG